MNPKLDEHAILFIQVVQALPEGLHNASTIPQFGYESGIVTDPDEEKGWLRITCGRIATHFEFPIQGDGKITLPFCDVPIVAYQLDRWQAVAGTLSGQIDGLVRVALDRYIDTGEYIAKAFGVPCPSCKSTHLEILELKPGVMTTARIKCLSCGTVHSPRIRVKGNRLERLAVKGVDK